MKKFWYFFGYWIWPFHVLWGKEYNAALTVCLSRYGGSYIASHETRNLMLSGIVDDKKWARLQRPAVRRAYIGWLNYYKRYIQSDIKNSALETRRKKYECSGQFPEPPK